MNHPVILDWLDVTYSPESTLLNSVELFLDSMEFHVGAKRSDGSTTSQTTWRCQKNGTVVLTRNCRWHRISASGRTLQTLRNFSVLDEFLTVLSDAPYNITRLDAAKDIDEDGADHVAAMIEKYSKACRLTRKLLPTSWIMETRDDGRSSGTFYVGDRRVSGVNTARVYDKQLQMLKVFGEVISPRVRYEVTARRQLPLTLRDASQPTTLFYHLAAPSLLPRPRSVHNWVPSDPDDLGWTCVMPEILPYQTLQSRVDTSPDLQRLVELAVKCGPQGRRMLRTMLEQREIIPTRSANSEPVLTPDLPAQRAS